MPFSAAAMGSSWCSCCWAAVDDMLFRRVMRCGCIEPNDMECECGRFLGSEWAMLDECRCWLVGRAVIGSCSSWR